MSVATPTLSAPGRVTPRTRRQRAAALISSALAAVLGIAPHVLHHAGPLAGAALLAGSTSTLRFGAIGFLAAIPFLLRVHRRAGNWRVPGALLALFAIVFSLSTFVIGPAVNGESSSTSGSSTRQTGAQMSADHHGHHL